MTLQDAIMLSAPHRKGATTLAVTSDGSIYINADLLTLKAHAEKESLELHLIIGEMPEETKTKKLKENGSK